MRMRSDRSGFSRLTVSITDRPDGLRDCFRRKANYSHSVLLCVFLWLFAAAARAGQAPVISAIPDQVTFEDVPILRVPFTVSDADTPLDQLRFSGGNQFSSGGLWFDNIDFGGTGSNRWFSIYPTHDTFGQAYAYIAAYDGTGWSARVYFNVQVLPVNDPPRFSLIPDQTALLGQRSLSVPFSVSDPDSPSTAVRLRAWSSRQSVVDNARLRFSPGTISPNRNLLITIPTTGVTGSTAITIEADDHLSSNTVSFVLNVLPPDFAPSGNSLPAAEGFQPIWGDFNGDGLLDLLVSTTQIFTNTGNGSLSAGIRLPDGILASNATAADFDGDGNLDLLFYGNGNPRLFRNSGGAAPMFSEVSLPGPMGQIFPIPRGRFFWADMDGDGAPDIVGAAPFEIFWLRNEGAGEFTVVGTSVPSFDQSGRGLIAIGDVDNDGYSDLLVGAGTTLRLYLNDGTGHPMDSHVDLPQRPIKAGGWVDVDGDGSLDLWLVQSSAGSPSTDSLVVFRQTGGRFIESFRLADPFPIPVWADFDNDGNVDFIGLYRPPLSAFNPQPRYPALYLNDGNGHFTPTGIPVAANFGELDPAVSDFDDDGSPDLLLRVGAGLQPLRNQTRAVNALPNAPADLHALVEGDSATLFWYGAADANQTAALSYNVRVGTAPGKNDVVASMSTTNGARMIPALGNAGFKKWFALKLPLERLSVETLYWTVQAVDNGFQGGPFAPEQTFFINPPGNQPPIISGIADLTMAEDTTNTLILYLTDDRTAPELLHVQATSSDTNLFPSANVTLSGFTVTNRALEVNLRLAPRADQSGQATITVTATDRGGLSTSRFFFVTVTPVNDPPVLTVADTLLAFAGAPTPPLAVSASDKESALDQLSLTAQSLTPLVVPDTNIVITRTEAGWQVVAVPANSEPAQAVIELTVRDPDGGQSLRNVTILFQQQLFTSFATLPVTGHWPDALIWADVNGDRVPYLLVGNAVGWGLTVHSVQPGDLPVVTRLTPPLTEGTPVDVGDFDNDGNVDVLAETLVTEGNVSRPKIVVYRNLGNFAFEQVPGAVFDPGAARFADFDQDGRPDVWVVPNPTNLVVYRNNGIGFDAARRLELIAPAPPELEAAMGLEIIDLDGDGVPELILSRYGYLSGNRRQTVYRRKGDSFKAITSVWAQYPILGIADFDQDQLPDLVSNYPKGGSILVWRNTGALNFNLITSLSPRTAGAAASADFDSDGITDVLGTSLFLGSTGMVFMPIEVPFARAYVPVIAPADFDGDGVLDVAVSLSSNDPTVPEVEQIAVYRGHSRRVNHPPTSPTNLRAALLAGNSVVLSWDRATDPEQPGGLTYNVRVGTAPGRGDVLGPMSLADGYRLLPRRGNAWWNTELLLTALHPGQTYYWTVQAVDNSFAGGPFATETSFTVPDAVLALRPAGTRGFELELHGAADGAWQVETSNDLDTWRNYSPTGLTMQTGTNGVSRLNIDLTAGRQFFRARRSN